MRKLAFCALLGLGLGGCQPLVQIEATEGNTNENPTGSSTLYWYRLGYVVGDLYMRLFFRTTIDAPEKLKTE